MKNIQEIENTVKKMDFEKGLKTLKMFESVLKRKARNFHLDIRDYTATTFIAPMEEDGAIQSMSGELEEIKEAARDYCRIRRILRQRYDHEIRQAKKADGLTHKRIAGINFIFPNI